MVVPTHWSPAGERAPAARLLSARTDRAPRPASTGSGSMERWRRL